MSYTCIFEVDLHTCTIFYGNFSNIINFFKCKYRWKAAISMRSDTNKVVNCNLQSHFGFAWCCHTILHFDTIYLPYRYLLIVCLPCSLMKYTQGAYRSIWTVWRVLTLIKSTNYCRLCRVRKACSWVTLRQDSGNWCADQETQMVIKMGVVSIRGNMAPMP